MVGRGNTAGSNPWSMALWLCACTLLAGCASPGQEPGFAQRAADGTVAAALARLLAGRPVEARTVLAPHLRATPQNGYLHLLNGLTYQLEEQSAQALDLAGVGYEAAARLAPGFYWSHYHQGAIELERQRYAAAAEQFAAAVFADPARPEAFRGLAAAAYFAGDLAVADAAIRAALAVDGSDAATLRAAAYIAAASGDAVGVSRLMERTDLAATQARELAAQQPRLEQLLRTSGLPDQGAAGAAYDAAAGADPPTQVMVEVTLLLSQNARARRTGINLLDGLSLQFSGARTTLREVIDDAPNTRERVTTTALSIPQINYSLNLFNTKDDYYEVLARPSLVASLAETSEFFIGRTITVGVSGVNLGSLQPVDVGTSVRVTPLEISERKAKFRVDASRSFFAQETGGTFEQSLTTFKQTVAATVDVEFGTTLILSGLYEGVNVGGSSKVPLLGDVPPVNLAFNARNTMTRQDAALVLVTPRLAGELNTGTATFRGSTLSRLLELWTSFIEPTGDFDAIAATLQAKRRYFRPLVGDIRLPGPGDRHILSATLADVAARLQ